MTDEKQRSLVHWDVRPANKEPLTLDEIIMRMNASVYGFDELGIEPSSFFVETRKEIENQVPTANNLKIKTADDNVKAKGILDGLKALLSNIKSRFDIDRETTDKIHKHILAIRNDIAEPVENAIRHLDGERKKYNTRELARKARANQTATEAAAAKRKNLTEKAEIARKSGDDVKAETIMAMAENVAPATIPIALTNITKTLEVTDVKLLLQEIIHEYPELIQYVKFPPASKKELIKKVFDINRVDWDTRNGIGRQIIRDKTGNPYGIIVAQKIK